MDQNTGTNVEQMGFAPFVNTGFAPFVNSVSLAGSIMPERFTSTSSPLPVSLVSPDLSSVSTPQVVSRRVDGME